MQRLGTNQLQNPKESIDVPSLVGCKSLGSKANLGSHPKFELVVGNLQEG